MSGQRLRWVSERLRWSAAVLGPNGHYESDPEHYLLSARNEMREAADLIDRLHEQKKALVESLRELVDAMHRYEAEAEGDQPFAHRDMMLRALVALAAVGEGDDE